MILKRSRHTKGFALLLGLTAPQPHFALHCFGFMLQWESARSEQEVIKRMPRKYHYLLRG